MTSDRNYYMKRTRERESDGKINMTMTAAD